MREKAQVFGARGNLVGITAEPDRERRIASAPAVILWNVGIHHRVGPFRVYVDMARELAQAGFVSLRFDVSGLGDSECTRDDPRPESERGVGDVQLAMDLVRERKLAERFVLIAFCSGVDVAHEVALVDPAVAGMVYIEGHRFRTPGYYLRHPRRYFDRDRWRRWLASRSPKLFWDGEPIYGSPNQGQQVYVRDPLTQAKLRADVGKMVGRGLKLMFVYAADADYAYKDQLFDMLGDRVLTSHVHVEYYPQADHTFFLCEDRDRMITDVVAWVARTFGGNGGMRASAASPAARTLA